MGCGQGRGAAVRALLNHWEEAKADVLGVYDVFALVERGKMPQELLDPLPATYLAGSSVRPASACMMRTAGASRRSSTACSRLAREHSHAGCVRDSSHPPALSRSR